MRKALLIANTLIIAAVIVCLYSCSKDEAVAPEGSVKALKVSSSDTTSGGTATTVALTGDQIRITPSLITDTANYIYITSETLNTYDCLNNTLLSVVNSSTSSQTVEYTGVLIPAAAYCNAGQKKAAITNVLYLPTNGTYSFSVKLNSTVYTGSVVKNGNNITFSWPYTSGVTISPLSL